jgi:hypothetical protein
VLDPVIGIVSAMPTVFALEVVLEPVMETP